MQHTEAQSDQYIAGSTISELGSGPKIWDGIFLEQQYLTCPVIWDQTPATPRPDIFTSMFTRVISLLAQTDDHHDRYGE